VSLARVGTSREFQVGAIVAQAHVACGCSNWDETRALATEGLTLARDAGLRHPECSLLLISAKGLFGAGDMRQARQVAASAEDLAIRCGYRPLANQAGELVRRMAQLGTDE
jgi:hypothetical protein